MNGFRVSLGVAASVAVHVGSMVALSLPAPPRTRQPDPAVIELAALPPPPPEPKPPEPPPPPPEDPKPEPQRPAKPTLAAPPPAEPRQPPQPASSPPLVLAGLSMSNAGVAVSSGFGVAAAPKPSHRETPVASTAPAKPQAPIITPVSDLSRKPVPPQLDSALSRFYPANLRNQGIEGEALIRVVLGKDGRVTQTAAVSESQAGFAQACEKALRTSNWEPPIDKAGNPTMTSLKYRCRFRVNL